MYNILLNYCITLSYIKYDIMAMSKRQKETLFRPGNTFWKARSKHGREAIFKDPQTLWQAAIEYFDWVEKNPIQTVEYKDGKKVNVPKLQAMTIQGISIFLGVNTKYFYDFQKNIDEKLIADPKGEIDPEAFKLNTEFTEIIRNIRDCIFQQKFTAAAAGLLKDNIVSRELGLMDKKEIDHKNNGKSFEPNNVTVFRIPDNNRPVVSMDKQVKDQ